MGFGGHALKPRFTPPPVAPVPPGQGQGAIEQVPPVNYDDHNDNDGTVTPPGASDAILPQPIEPPNTSPGINTPDNV